MKKNAPPSPPPPPPITHLSAVGESKGNSGYARELGNVLLERRVGRPRRQRHHVPRHLHSEAFRQRRSDIAYRLLYRGRVFIARFAHGHMGCWEKEIE